MSEQTTLDKMLEELDESFNYASEQYRQRRTLITALKTSKANGDIQFRIKLRGPDAGLAVVTFWPKDLCDVR